MQKSTQTGIIIGSGVLAAVGTLFWWLRQKELEMGFPAKGILSSKFGWRTFGGKRHLHTGIDIACKIGTEVKSPTKGTVYCVYNGTAGGKQIVIKHTNGFITGYAHLSEQLVNVGDIVQKGQIIAKSGNTGERTTGPHLHFTLKNTAGKLIDPLKYLV